MIRRLTRQIFIHKARAGATEARNVETQEASKTHALPEDRIAHASLQGLPDAVADSILALLPDKDLARMSGVSQKYARLVRTGTVSEKRLRLARALEKIFPTGSPCNPRLLSTHALAGFGKYETLRSAKQINASLAALAKRTTEYDLEDVITKVHHYFKDVDASVVSMFWNRAVRIQDQYKKALALGVPASYWHKRDAKAFFTALSSLKDQPLAIALEHGGSAFHQFTRDERNQFFTLQHRVRVSPDTNRTARGFFSTWSNLDDTLRTGAVQLALGNHFRVRDTLIAMSKVYSEFTSAQKTEVFEAISSLRYESERVDVAKAFLRNGSRISRSEQEFFESTLLASRNEYGQQHALLALSPHYSQLPAEKQEAYDHLHTVTSIKEPAYTAAAPDFSKLAERRQALSLHRLANLRNDRRTKEIIEVLAPGISGLSSANRVAALRIALHIVDDYHRLAATAALVLHSTHVSGQEFAIELRSAYEYGSTKLLHAHG